MPREDIEFRTGDNVILRGWFYTSNARQSASDKLPCLVLSHGMACIKEMGLDAYAEYFTSKLLINCLVYDHRGFGSSDTAPGQPRQEAISSFQMSDLADAITYAQMRPDVDKEKIGLWGYSYSGGHSINLAATDRRVKALMVVGAFTNGWVNFHRYIRPDVKHFIDAQLQEDRLNRAAGGEPGMMPVMSSDPAIPAGIPGIDSFEFFSKWENHPLFKNQITLRTAEDVRRMEATAHVPHVSPTPFLMTVADQDVSAVLDSQLQAFESALHPKELQMLHGHHFSFFNGENFELTAARQTEFLSRTLCKHKV